MKKLLLILTMLFTPTLAWGQCNGVFPSNTMCGSVLGGAPGPVAFSTFNPVFNTISAVTALTAVPSGNVVNNFQITSDNVDAGTGFILGAQRKYVFGGSSTKGGRIAGYDFVANSALTSATNLNRAYVGTTSIAYSQVGEGGTNTASGALGGYFGTNPICQLDSGAVNVNECTGTEIDVQVATGASARYLRNLSLVNFNGAAIHGGQIDSALTFSASSGSWNNPILFTDVNRNTSQSPVNANTTLFGTYWQSIGTQTVLNGIDLSGFAFTGNAFIGSSLVGGSAASSTLTLGSTSGAGTTDSIVFKTASQVQRGSIATGGFWGVGSQASTIPLDINAFANSASVPAPVAGATFRVVGADAVGNSLEMNAFGSNNTFFSRRANGTAAAKTGLIASDVLVALSASGWTSAAAYSGSAAAFRCIATETWSGTATGSQCDIRTVPNTTTTLTTALSVFNSGGVGVGSAAADPGIGKVNATNGYSSGGTAGLSVTKTVRAAGGAADCNLVFTGGLLTGGTC